MSDFLRDYQKDAVARMRDGCILNGGTGSGKSRTGLYYYFKEFGGSMDPKFCPMNHPKDLYIITTPMKRDSREWDYELASYSLSRFPETNGYSNKVVVDSWNNIKKYTKIYDAFFLFDEDRVVGSGAWVKAFLQITRKNRWILLSATPGDSWIEYWAIFVANGYYKNKTDFTTQHVIYKRWSNFPMISGYMNEKKLEKLRSEILIDMEFARKTVQNHLDIWCEYDKTAYKTLFKDRWNVFENKPIENASELCYLTRKIVNSDPSRAISVLEIVEKHPKIIIFYSFDYELEILKNLGYPPGTDIYEWNGHRHDKLPKNSDSWVYLVQYTAGCEGWNCIETNVMLFYSQQYSYKVFTQACGRIDRMNTPFKDLYYYHLKSHSGIDMAISKAIREKKQFNERKWVIW